MSIPRISRKPHASVQECEVVRKPRRAARFALERQNTNWPECRSLLPVPPPNNPSSTTHGSDSKKNPPSFVTAPHARVRPQADLEFRVPVPPASRYPLLDPDTVLAANPA